MSAALVRRGRVWKFGDNVNTDSMLPNVAFRLPLNEQHRHCFEAIRPGWVTAVRPGDLIVAGENFAIGSSRPVGRILRVCGIAGVAAHSVNGLGLRSCVNDGVPAIGCPGVGDLFADGETGEIDFSSGKITNLDRGTSIQAAPLAPLLADIVVAGGVMPMLIREGYVESTSFVAADG